ncbi:MAG: CPBP family intramembrane metalloprotease [Anaerolineaceae bacterium]|nr:MAG: CPBP family intramembrane metalloprotease [Anaerolineaceae bacterium]
MINKNYDPKEIPQLSWAGLVGLFALPVGWWFIVLHVIGPRLLPSITTPEGEINGYALNLISLSCYLFEFLLAAYVLRREGQTLTWSTLKIRLNLYWGDWKTWMLFIILLVVGVALTFPLMATSKITALAAPPPDWFPASQNPLKELKGIEDALPGVEFKGNYLFLTLFIFTGVMNILGEDTLYRGVLIPKLHGLFGKRVWLVGGLIFSLKHIYVWWRIQETLPLAIAGAFMFGSMGSLSFAMLAHFIGNFGLTWPLVIKEVLFG